MKKLFIVLTVIMLLNLFSISSYACTSFAVYSEKVYYGMNLDYPDVNLKLNINRYGDAKLFHLDLEYEKDKYVQHCGMNSSGLFTSNQMVLPEQINMFLPSEKILDMLDLTTMVLTKYQRVKDIEKFIKDERLVNIYAKCSLHDIFADKSGNAMIVEAGVKNNLITKMQDKFIVMTNFLNNSLIGKNYSEASGAGADRYKAAYEYINSKKDDFSIDDGLEVLKKTVQGKKSGWPTQCSMLFDPEKNEVYVVLKHDFCKVWKVSIDRGEIETFTGFEKHVKMKFDYNGITLNELANPEKISSFNWSLLLGFVIGISIIVFITSCFFKKRKSVKKFIW